MFIRFIFVEVILIALLHGEDISYDYELDAYYSNVSLFVKIGDENITDATDYSEVQIYTDLFLKSFQPNVFLVEFAVHPIPIAGLAYRNAYEEQYEKSYVKEMDINMVRALTAGFEEPYSLSLFLGRMMVFQCDDSDHIGHNRAYVGYLLTVGDYTIKDNRAIYDKWLNPEIKLKGTRDVDEHTLDWSFRVGARIHGNSDFSNSVYLGARRSRIDFEHDRLSWLYNSAFETVIVTHSDRLKLMQFQVIAEKKWPIDKVNKMTLGLGIGYHYDANTKYKGELRDEGVNNHQLIIRPNISF